MTSTLKAVASRCGLARPASRPPASVPITAAAAKAPAVRRLGKLVH